MISGESLQKYLCIQKLDIIVDFPEHSIHIIENSKIHFFKNTELKT